MSDVKSSLRPAPSRRNNQFLSYLLSTDLNPSLHRPCIKPLVVVQATDSLPYVFRRLSSQGILAAPVLEGSRYKGFISMFDIVNYITEMNWGSSGEEWAYFFDNSLDFKCAVVAEVMETDLWRNQQTALPMYQSNTTMHALEKLAVTGAHRAAVITWNSKVVNVMTQSMLISELRQRMYMLGDLRTRRVSELVDFWTVVRTVSEDSTAMNAFISMRENNVQGLAVVDADGVLTGSISVRDMRGIGQDAQFFSRLFRSVKEFKDTTRTEFPALGPKGHYYVGNIPLKARYVTPDSTFETVINMMADGCIHRLFVCSRDSVFEGRPIPDNVITQTTVLKFMLRYFASPCWSFEVDERG